jgi:hypothetical protein
MAAASALLCKSLQTSDGACVYKAVITATAAVSYHYCVQLLAAFPVGKSACACTPMYAICASSLVACKPFAICCTDQRGVLCCLAEALYKNLKNGETVQNDNGIAIPAAMVCSEDKPGRSVVLLPACNSADNIGPHAVNADIMVAAAGAAAAYGGGQIGAGLGMCAQQWGVRNLLVTAMPSSNSSSSSASSACSASRQRRSSSSSSSDDGSQNEQQQQQQQQQQQRDSLDPAAAAALSVIAEQYTRGTVIPARDDMSMILEENLGELDPPPIDLEAIVSLARTTCLQV